MTEDIYLISRIQGARNSSEIAATKAGLCFQMGEWDMGVWFAKLADEFAQMASRLRTQLRLV